jgi:hypothetical protein
MAAPKSNVGLRRIEDDDFLYSTVAPGPSQEGVSTLRYAAREIQDSMKKAISSNRIPRK